jgi:hypothetical protein
MYGQKNAQSNYEFKIGTDISYRTLVL